MIFDGSELERRRKDAKDGAGLSRHDVMAEFIRRGDSITERTLTRWEMGETQPKANHLSILASILGCEVQDFFQPEKERPKAIA